MVRTTPTRSTTTRERHRAMIRRGEPPCGICGEPIDYSIKDHLHPRSFVVDHIVPLASGGDDVISNKQAAHRACNRTKGNRVDGGSIMRRSGSLVRLRNEQGGSPPPTPGRPSAA